MRVLFFIFICLGELFAHQNSIGIGAIYSTTPYKSQDDKTLIVPIINYTKDNFYIKALELGYQYNYFISLIGQPRLSGEKIEGVEEKKNSFEIGIKITYPIDDYKLTYKALFESLGVYNGFRHNLSLSKTFVQMPFIFIPNIGLEYQDAKTSEYYFGVKESTIYPKYDVGDTFCITGGFVGIFNISKRYAFNLIYNYKKLDTKITQSPIVATNNKQNIIGSFVYKF